LALICLPVLGCDGADFVDDTISTITETVSRAPHRDWNSYNVYRFQDGVWIPVIVLGQPIAGIPHVGDRPAIILHGLGSDIASGRFNDLAIGMQQSGVTDVLGFEYDTLSGIGANGNLFIEAFTDPQRRTRGFSGG
jgi:hypothetical protein